MGRKKTISDSDLLEVARTVFVQDGFGASTREIARRAGVSEGVLFQRFTTKEDLFFAAMIPPVADLTRLFEDRGSHGLALFEKIILSMIDYFRATLPVMLPLMAHPSFRFEEFAKLHPDLPLAALRRDLTQFMARERVAGRIGPVDPGAAALSIWSVAHTVAFFERFGAHGGRMPPEIVKATVHCLWNGLAPGEL